MKIKEINRTANLAWSPKQQYPIYLAAGTAAQQLDATFSTSASLEIFHVDLSNKDFDMPLAGKLESNRRFNTLAWTDFDSSGIHSTGLIIGGADNGEICIYDPAAILAGNDEKALVHTLTDHSGPVQSIDLNKFQNHLFASGSSNSEILIWDLKNPLKGLVPGPKTNPPDQINCVKWNKQVGHILAASSQTSRVVVWDLRKSEPIIKVGDQSAMFHYKTIEWHPDVATQMLIGNEDDRYPVIQMWDLRFATSPVKIFEGHSRGIMSLAWCPQDSDLLMSCGKDNRILCWNPNTQAPTGEIIYELPATAQWTSDIRWCPRFPGIISTSSFDGHVAVSSVMGGVQQVNQQQQSQISDSFGIQQDAFNLPPQQQQQQTVIIEPLKKPPKWMRKPCRASFSFGGKLVSFGVDKEPGVPKQVFVSQVVTEPDFLQQSQELENSLITGQLTEFCDMKIAQETNEKERLLWQFLKSNFHNEPRIQFLNLLGYNPQDLAQKISKATADQPVEAVGGVNLDELTSKMEKLKAENDALSNDSAVLGSGSNTPFDGSKTPGSETEGSAMFDAIAAQTAKDGIIEELEEIKKSAEPFAISVKDDADGLICQALLTGNFEAAVDVCFKEERMADGLLLAIAGGPDLFSRTQKRYLEQAKSPLAKMISAVVNRDWTSIVENAVIENWKEALCTLVTYSKAEEFSDLCCRLGERLEQEVHDFNSALICYICAGNVEKMVACWTRSTNEEEQKPANLQNLIEKVMILKRSVENGRYQTTAEGTFMADQLCKYASLLSSQGSLQTAMVYLSAVDDKRVSVLKDRIFRAHGNLHGQPPEFPFERTNISTRPNNKTKQPVTKSPMQTFDRHSYNNPTSSGFPHSAPKFSPVTTNVPSPFYDPSTQIHNTAPISPPSTNLYNPNAGAANMYPQPPSVSQPNYYQPSPLSTGNTATINSTPMVNGSSNFQGSPPMTFNPNMSMTSNMTSNINPSTVQPTLFNPMSNQVQPLTPGAPPNVFSPGAMMNNSQPQNPYQPPPQPSIMQPLAKTPDVGPPRSDRTHPMSMKAARQESPSQPVPPQEPLNFYNPAAQQHQMGTVPPQTTPTPNIMSLQGAILPGQTQIMKPPVKQEPPKPVKMKGPIPAEHMILQQTYDALVEKCRSASQSPQVKRKLEDVNRKLEILYDLLRENKVSPNVLNNLHQIVQVCQSSDYMAGLQIHTHMITTGNFSEISSFMPGLKTLMQIANQLRV